MYLNTNTCEKNLKYLNTNKNTLTIVFKYF